MARINERSGKEPDARCPERIKQGKGTKTEDYGKSTLGQKDKE